MKTKITLLGFAVATIFSSCSKETFTMSSNTGGFGTYHKEKKEVAKSEPATTTEIAEPILTASTGSEPAAISNIPSFTTPKAAKTAIKTDETAATTIAAPVAVTKKEIKAAVKSAKKEIKGTQGTSAEGKNQIVAAILAFLLGGFGIHRFYLGYTGKGILQLSMFLVGAITSLFLIGIPILIGLWVWVLIDFIRILTGGLKPQDGDYGSKI